MIIIVVVVVVVVVAAAAATGISIYTLSMNNELSLLAQQYTAECGKFQNTPRPSIQGQ